MGPRWKKIKRLNEYVDIQSSKGRILLSRHVIKTHTFLMLVLISCDVKDPVMFTGSVRFNVDPFGLYPDQGIWESLEHAHLKTFVASLDEGLDYECGEGGEALR